MENPSYESSFRIAYRPSKNQCRSLRRRRRLSPCCVAGRPPLRRCRHRCRRRRRFGRSAGRAVWPPSASRSTASGCPAASAPAVWCRRRRYQRCYRRTGPDSLRPARGRCCTGPSARCETLVLWEGCVRTLSVYGGVGECGGVDRITLVTLFVLVCMRFMRAHFALAVNATLMKQYGVSVRSRRSWRALHSPTPPLIRHGHASRTANAIYRTHRMCRPFSSTCATRCDTDCRTFRYPPRGRSAADRGRSASPFPWRTIRGKLLVDECVCVIKTVSAVKIA